MLLLDARCWAHPVNYLAYQSVAVRGQMDGRRTNYYFDRLGLVVRNKKVILEMHDTSYTDLELKLFTKENLAKANGSFTRTIQDSTQASGVAHKDEYDNIPSNGQEAARLAWRNWETVRLETLSKTLLILQMVFSSTV